ncbi:hypothetical protein ACQ4M4_14115 [Leptolyngbya sp. AN02str]|uniref:hypothetical protein n=1 Tax=Leptolyngbya sp. AN02str TaxID=3423363 RepID=UPI003D31A267
MNRNREPKQPTPPDRLRLSPPLAIALILRSDLTGLMAGDLLGVVLGTTFFFVALWTGWVGAVLGVSLGIANGFLLSGLTAWFYSPLRRVRQYRALAMVLGAGLASSGAAIFGPWYFATTAMTPTYAVLIGFHSVLASVIAGCAGALIGKNLAHCYEQADSQQSRSGTSARISVHPFHPHSASIWATQKYEWMGLTLLTLLCSFWGYGLLQFAVCGYRDVYVCLPSPRLFTSVVAGFRVVLPIAVALVVIGMVWGYRPRRRR